METKALLIVGIAVAILLIALNITQKEDSTTTTQPTTTSTSRATTSTSTTAPTTSTTRTTKTTSTTTTLATPLSRLCDRYNVTCNDLGSNYEVTYTCDGQENTFYTAIKDLSQLEEELKNIEKACEEMIETRGEAIERNKKIEESRYVYKI